MAERVNTASRAMKILEVARVHTGEDMTIDELADFCDMLPGKTFSLALAEARHIALDNDELITGCVWNPRARAQTLRHIYSHEEEGAAFNPLCKRQNDAATRLRNVGRVAEWVGRNAEASFDRKFGREVAEFARSSERTLRYISNLAEQARKNR